MKSRLKTIGRVITVFAIILLIIKISKIDLDWSMLLNKEHIGAILICVVIYAGMMFLCALQWKKLVEIFCGQIGQYKKQRILFCYVFLKSNILKYIPGNVLQYVGRNQIALEMGISHVGVAMASVAETVIMVVNALMVSAATAGPYAKHFLKQWLVDNAIPAVLVLTAIIILAAVLTRFYGRIDIYMKQYLGFIRKRGAAKSFLAAFGVYLIVLSVNAFIFVFVLKMDNYAAISGKMIPVIAGSYMLSWLIGYITPGAPGGIGVREVILITIIQGIGLIEDGVIIQAAVVVRLITVVGDLVAFLAALGLHTVFNHRRDVCELQKL